MKEAATSGEGGKPMPSCKENQLETAVAASMTAVEVADAAFATGSDRG